MNQTLLVKLALTLERYASILRTLVAFNAACNAIAEVAEVAYEQRLANKNELQKVVCYDVRQRYGLSARIAIRAFPKVAETDKRDTCIKPSFRYAARSSAGMLSNRRFVRHS